MDKKTIRISVGLLAFYFAAVPVLWSQGTSEDDIIILEEVQADDVSIEESILATTRPISSVYGSERSVLDTPRNVNIVSREQLDAISIRDVRDFSKLTSSAYTKTNFGAPTAPNLRGQEADLMINGVRRGHSTNGNGVPINFNSVESVNIVKGPAGAVYGNSNYVGGYVDLITKRAFFSEGGSVEYTWGSYGQHTVAADVNIPISETLAVRFSFEGKDWKGFWDRWYQESQALYTAVAWKPNEKYRADFMGEFYKGNYTENWGVNRVTQDLFDKGLYIPNRPGEPANYTDGPPGGFGNVVPVDINNPVDVDPSWKLSAPGDDSNATVVWLEAIQEYTASDTLKFTNSTYFHYKDRDTWSSYHYSEWMKDNWSFDNRFQVEQKFEFAEESELTLNYGMRFRYQDIWAVSNFFNEPVNFFDLTQDPSLNVVQEPAFDIYYYIPGKGRGGLDNWYVGETNLGFNNGYARDTQTLIAAPFIQGDWKINDQFSILAGVTAEYVDHTEKIPDEVVPSFIGAVPVGKFDSQDADNWMFNYNLSGIFKPTANTSLYATVNVGESYLTETGGRVLVATVEDPGETLMYELGFNASLLDNKLYLGSALFYQEYSQFDPGAGRPREVETLGFEIELNYQPNKNFFATMGYSWLDSESTNTFFATPYTADRAAETGGDYVSPTFEIGPEGQFYENPGVPEHLLNFLAQYKFDNGIGIQANLVAWGEMNSGYEGYDITLLGSTTPTNGDPAGTPIKANTARLGIQYEIDAKIFYEYKNWLFEFSAFNITQEENWDVNNSGYGNGSAVGRPDFNYEVSVKYAW